MEKDRKEYLKARKTMDLKYSRGTFKPEDFQKVETQINMDLKNSFKNLFGDEYEALAGKDVVSNLSSLH